MRKIFKKYKLILFLVLIFLIIFSFSFTSEIKPLKNILFVAEKPFVVAGNFLINRLTLFGKNFFHLTTLGKENQDLIKENLKLQSELSMLKEVQHENEILKNEIGLMETNQTNSKLLPANIVGRSSLGYIKTIVIDRGSKDNLKIGQAVTSQGYLVGTIKEVFKDSAEVILITDYNSVVPAVLQDSRGTGLLRGGLNGLILEEIPLNISIKDGEQVIASGLGGDMPAGILIGKAGKIISHEGEIFQKITINSPIQIYFLEFVFVAQ